MKNEMPAHYWRIHARVARRMMLDTPELVRHIIAHDATHATEQYRWFERKVNDDAMRLFMDPSYYDNADFTFRIPKRERV